LQHRKEKVPIVRAGHGEPAVVKMTTPSAIKSRECRSVIEGGTRVVFPGKNLGEGEKAHKCLN